MSKFRFVVCVLVFSVTAAAQQSSVVLTGTQPAPSSGATGTSAANPLVVQGVKGGNDSSTSSGTAGAGSGDSITAGDGGDGTGTGNNTGGTGGSLTLATGNGGASVGTVSANANGGDMLLNLGTVGGGGPTATGRGGSLLMLRPGAATDKQGGDVSNPLLCGPDPKGICLYWLYNSTLNLYNILAFRDCTGGSNCPNSGNQVAVGLDDQGTRYAVTGAVRFMNSNPPNPLNGTFDACLVDDGTGLNTLAISAPGAGNCGSPSANQHTGHLSLTNLNAYGNITLNGSTSGSSVLNVTPTGGTLNLGSTNATVDSSGDYSGVSATLTTPANSSTTPLTISQGATTGATSVPALSIAETWNNSLITGPVFSLSLTNTASASNSKVMNIAVGGSPVFEITPNGIAQSAFYGALTNASNADFCGGTCSGSTSGAQGGGTFQGMDNSSTNSAAAGGYAIFRGGMLTATTPSSSALEGVVEVGEGYLKGTIGAIGDVVCQSGTGSVSLGTGIPLVQLHISQ